MPRALMGRADNMQKQKGNGNRTMGAPWEESKENVRNQKYSNRNEKRA